MKKTAFLLVIFSAILWGSSCLFVSWLTPYGISGMGITTIRAIVSVLFIGLFMLVKDRSALKVAPKKLLLLALCGLALLGSSASYFTSIGLTSVATAVVLMYTAPVFVMLFSVAFLGEKMSVVKAISVLLMLGGCVFVSGIIGDASFHLGGILLGLLAGVSFAAYNIFAKIVMKKEIGTLTANFYTFLFMSLFGLVLCNPTHTFGIVGQNPMPMIPLLLLTGIVTGAVPYLMYAAALKHVPAGIAASLSVIEPMASVILGFILLDQKITLLTVLGVVMIIVAVFLLAPRASDKQKGNE